MKGGGDSETEGRLCLRFVSTEGGQTEPRYGWLMDGKKMGR